MSDVKLPKQWKDWCKSANLRVNSFRNRQKDLYNWLYLKGRGRHWRVNCFNMLQRGDTYDEFDRWALCEIEEVPLPRTKAEFLAAVEKLSRTLEKSANPTWTEWQDVRTEEE